MPSSPLFLGHMPRLNRPPRRWSAAAWAALLLSGFASPAQARQRLLIVVTTEGVLEADAPTWTHVPDLDGQLTELAIAAAAERGDYELVGLREAQRYLPGGPSTRDLASCLDDEICLGSLAAGAAVQRALIGRLRWDGPQMVLRLTLVDPFTMASNGAWARALDVDLPTLTAVFQEGVRTLLLPGTTQAPRALSIAQGPIAPAAPPATLSLAVRPQEPPSASRSTFPWRPTVGYATGALAAISFSAGAVAGGLAAVSPAGRTRAEAQMDLQQRKEYAHAANDLLLIGGALAIVSLGTLLWHWRSHRSSP